MVSAKETNEMSQEVFKAIFVNDFDGLRKIYADHDLSADLLDEHGMTPLQHAAYKGNEQIVRWLLDRVSDYKRRNVKNCIVFIFTLLLCRRSGCRRQLGKAQISVHRVAFRRTQR